MALVPSAGGALLPYQKQRFKTDVAIDGNLVVTGTINSNGATGPTITDPTIADGLTASGSASNDFSGSTGTFKTSTGANTLGGAVSIADATTPSLTTATGKTNTGFVTVLGKTSGGLKVTTADATAQTVTISAAAQTSGASTLTIPDQAGVSSSFVFTTLAQTLTNKVVTSSSASAGFGYATGAGGTGTQGTDKSTTVVMSPNPCLCGSVTTNAAALNAATIVSFDVTDSAVGVADVVIINHISGGTLGAYTVNAHGASGKFVVTLRNNTAGNLSEALVLQFAVIKAVTS